MLGARYRTGCTPKIEFHGSDSLPILDQGKPFGVITPLGIPKIADELIEHNPSRPVDTITLLAGLLPLGYSLSVAHNEHSEARL